MKKFKEQWDSKNSNNRRVYIQANDMWIRIMCKFLIISKSSSAKFFYIKIFLFKLNFFILLLCFMETYAGISYYNNILRENESYYFGVGYILFKLSNTIL